MTPLAQALPSVSRRGIHMEASGVSLAMATPLCPWWWRIMRRRQDLDDSSECECLESRLWKRVGFFLTQCGYALSQFMYTLQVPVCCCICTVWFATVVIRSLARVVIGEQEYGIWTAVLHEWFVGLKTFPLFGYAAAQCTISFGVSLTSHVLAHCLPPSFLQYL